MLSNQQGNFNGDITAKEKQEREFASSDAGRSSSKGIDGDAQLRSKIRYVKPIVDKSTYCWGQWCRSHKK